MLNSCRAHLHLFTQNMLRYKEDNDNDDAQSLPDPKPKFLIPFFYHADNQSQYIRL